MKNKFMISYIALCTLMAFLTVKVAIERGTYELDGILYMGCTEWHGKPTVALFGMTLLMSTTGIVISLFYRGKIVLLASIFILLVVIMDASIVYYESLAVPCPENSRSLRDAARVAAWAA